MRVIAGTARRLKLKEFEGDKIRPTSDRIKETLFNIIQDDVVDSRFLDLFAGTGAIGIEALSRGASEAIFVDSLREAIKIIEYNVSHTKMIKRSQILHMDYAVAIKRLGTWGKKFDIIFIDPPYHAELYEDILKNIKSSNILAENGMIILESLIDMLNEDKIGEFKVYKVKKYKNNKHIFLSEDYE